MRNKATLTLLEQSVMLLVFAVAAALCLKAFLWADQTSRESAALDGAVLCAQNAAEQLRHTGGAWSGDVRYDENWRPTDGEWVYRLTVTPQESGLACLGKAEVTVSTAAGKALFSLPAAWQEVSAGEG